MTKRERELATRYLGLLDDDRNAAWMRVHEHGGIRTNDYLERHRALEYAIGLIREKLAAADSKPAKAAA